MIFRAHDVMRHCFPSYPLVVSEKQLIVEKESLFCGGRMVGLGQRVKDGKDWAWEMESTDIIGETQLRPDTKLQTHDLELRIPTLNRNKCWRSGGTACDTTC